MNTQSFANYARVPAMLAKMTQRMLAGNLHGTAGFALHAKSPYANLPPNP